MSTRKPTRKTYRKPRRLLKIASLGIAGFIAGLLSGCSSSPTTFSLDSYSQNSGWHFESTCSYTSHHKNLDARPIPDLRHPPAPHRTESWADRTPHPQVVASQFDPGRTLTNYDFTSDRYSSNSGSGHLSAQ